MVRGYFEGAVENAPRYFRCIPLGVEGGLIESNLPAYLLAPIGSTDFVCLDAGTLLARPTARTRSRVGSYVTTSRPS
jgi:hypothetical protein